MSVICRFLMTGLRDVRGLAMFIAMVLFACLPLMGQSVEWNPGQDKLTADFRKTRLDDALKSLGSTFGWNVFIEPGLESRVVSTRFSNQPLTKALRRIMGDLNYALIRKGGPETSRLLVYATSASKATQKLELADQVLIFHSKRIDNELIIQIKPGSTLTIEEIASLLDAKIVGKIEGLDAYRLRFDDAASADKARARLRDSEAVQMSDNYEWGRPGINQAFTQGSNVPISLKAGESDGNEIIVGLIDMPVQSGEESLSEFLLPGISIGNEHAVESGIPSHGTSMAQTVLKGVELGNKGQIETSVKLLPVDVYGGNETTSTFQVTAGIYEAVRAGADIINLSLGGGDAVPVMEQMIREASQQGVLFVGAAGNTPGQHPVFPAAYPDVLAVTAAGGDGEAAAYANTGDFVDVMVPGRSYIEYQGTTYMINGTSASAAYVSGLAASISSNTGQPVRQVESELRQNLPKP